MSSESDSELSSDDLSEETASWIAWFCGIRGNEFFCMVDEEYISDSFNLSGLREEVPHYDMALETILDADQPNLQNMSEQQQESVDAAAELLYGLIHARFILTAKGLTLMNEKFLECSFGQCANFLCQGQALLPVGVQDQPRKSNVHLYCPKCNGVFHPPSSRHSNIDGAYFGTSFPHLMLLTYPASRPPPQQQSYVPKIFGFRVFHAVGGAGYTGSSSSSSSSSSAAAASVGGGGGAASVLALPQLPAHMRPHITSVLDRTEDGKDLLAPDGRRLVIENEDFLDLEELVAQQVGPKRSKGRGGGGR